MKIGPVDIRNRTFTRRLRGADESEVREFLDLVADRLEEAVLEGEELRARIGALEAEVAEYRSLERSMRDSMLSAERLVDERAAQAEKEAQIVIKKAEVEADRLLVGAREEAGRLRAEIEDLRRQRLTYIERFRALLRSQARILEASLQDLDPDGDPGDRRRALEEAERPVAPPREEPAASTPAGPASPKTAPPPPPPAPAPVPSGSEPEPFRPYLGEQGLFAPGRPEGLGVGEED